MLISDQDRSKIIDHINVILSDYEIEKRCTEVATLESVNDDLIKQYAACKMIDGLSPKTIKSYTDQLRRFDTSVQKQFTKVSTSDVRSYIAMAKVKGRSPGYLENIRAYLMAFYDWMVTEEIMDKNPMISMKPIKIPKVKRLAFSDVDLEKLRMTCGSMRDRSILELLLTSGLRAEELEALNINDVDLKNNTVYVRNGKGGKDRTCYITNVTAEYIRKYLDTRTDGSCALFISKRADRLTTGGLRAMLRKLGQDAGVSDVHPHRFRRTCATNLGKRGMNAQDIREILGHSNLNTTMTYVNVEQDTLRENYRRFA